VSVRVERLQDITDNDAGWEGILEWEKENVYKVNSVTSRDLFKLLWDTLYAKKPALQWEANPWVWVVEFNKKESNG